MTKPVASVENRTIQAKASKRRKARPPKPQQDFFWVDCYEPKVARSRSHDRGVQQFIKIRNDRLRRDERLRTLKASTQPFPSQSLNQNGSNSKSNELYPKDDRVAKLVFYQGPTAGCWQDYTAKVAYPLSSSDPTLMCARLSVDQPIIMQTLLSQAASTWASILKAGNAPLASVRIAVQHSLQMREFAIKSIQGLIGEIAESKNEALLWAVANIYGIECAEGNVQVTVAHGPGIKSIINKLGGMKSLSQTMLSTLAVADVLVGLNTSLPLALEMPPEWSTRALDGSALMCIDSGISLDVQDTTFFASPWSQYVPIDLLNIIRSLQQLIPFHEHNLEKGKYSVTDANDYFIMLARRVLDLPSEADLTPFQETIRISTFIYCTTRILYFSKKACMLNLVRFLRESLEKSLKFFQKSAPDLLLWVFFMACIASYVGHGTEAHKWASAGLIQSAQQLSILEWNDAVPVLGRFLLFHRRNDPAKSVWEEMRHVRKHRV